MSNTKKYIITSLTLCALSAVAALAIAGTNMLTKSKIENNTKQAMEKSLKEVFPNALSFSEKKDDFKFESKYLVNYYIAYEDENKANEVGYVYYVDGRNSYGEIALMVGVNQTGVEQISVVINTESYASTLEDNYINPFISGSGSLDDVSCGATYGATLIKNMTDASLQDYQLQKE